MLFDSGIDFVEVHNKMKNIFCSIRLSKTISILSIVMILFMLAMRFVGLEQDLPPWGITNYTPGDEGNYSVLALNKQIYGKINPGMIGNKYMFYTPTHLRTNIIGNFATFVGLSLLGDNYYGLRIPTVIFGLLNFILFLLILNLINKKYNCEETKDKKTIVLFMALYLSCDFIFFIASRVVEPSIVRMLFAQVIFYICLKFDDKQMLRLYLLGLVVTLSVFFVYISNLFFYFPCVILSIYKSFVFL